MDELHKIKEETEKEKLTNKERLKELQNLNAPIVGCPSQVFKFRVRS